jgi:hypothetical protein
MVFKDKPLQNSAEWFGMVDGKFAVNISLPQQAVLGHVPRMHLFP